MVRNKQTVPLCVDLDGTLVCTDTLFELLLAWLKRYPSQWWRLPLWWWRGRAYLKRQLAQAVELDVALLPYHQSFLDYLKKEHMAGRRLIMCTAADETVARRVAEHLNIFSDVLASDGVRNLKGSKKATLLSQMFGQEGFDYAGNALSDVLVWQQARQVVVVGASARVQRLAAETKKVEQVFAITESRLRALGRALRPHQWIKNILVFVPMIMAHRFFDGSVLAAAVEAWLSLSVCASALYVLNDALDLSADRRHTTKRFRPLAAGQLPLSWAVVAIPLLLLVSFLIGSLLPRDFNLILLAYALGSLVYSLWLKQVVLLDVIFLSGLYAIRLLAGAKAADVPISFWLLAFSIFFFMSLALVKRVAELVNLSANQGMPWGRGYQAEDIRLLATLGATSGYLSVLVLALYINSQEVMVLYQRPELLWVICPLLLYWISRLWLLAHRGQVNEDPILFAFSDKISYALGGLVTLIVILAI